jgi:hypothetical protein
VLECGLKALAAHPLIGIDYQPSWDAYLRKINANIEAPYQTKILEWKKHQAFFRDAAGDLVLIKIHFRNPSMHVEQKYDPDEAKLIFDSSKALMQRLARDLPPRCHPLERLVKSIEVI